MRGNRSVMDPEYSEIVRLVERFAGGYTTHDMTTVLVKIAKKLKNKYGIEPVDIVAALCLFKKGKYDYGYVLLGRAYRDLERIGKQRGWL